MIDCYYYYCDNDNNCIMLLINNTLQSPFTFRIIINHIFRTCCFLFPDAVFLTGAVTTKSSSLSLNANFLDFVVVVVFVVDVDVEPPVKPNLDNAPIASLPCAANLPAKPVGFGAAIGFGSSSSLSTIDAP
eukprot:UN04304